MLKDLIARKFVSYNLSSGELGALWQPPPAGVQVQRVPCRWVPPRDPRKVEVDPANPEHITLGYILGADDQWLPTGCSYRDFRFLAHVTAPMGRGKSEWLKWVFRQFMQAGCGCMMVDCKGTDLINGSLPFIPREREKDVAIMEISGSSITGDLMFPAMNLFSPQFAKSMGLDNSKLASTMMQVFGTIDSRFKDATIMPLFASMGVLALLESEPKATLAHLMRFFYDEDYRADCITRIKNPTVYNFWAIRFPLMEKQQLTPLKGFENRVDRLLAFPEIGAMMIAPGCSLDIRRIMDNNGILLAGIKVSDGEIADLAAMLLLTQLQLATLSRNNVPEAQRPDFPVVIDEAQIVYNKAPELGEVQFAQFRALRVGSIIVHQNMEQLPAELRAALEGNAQIRVILGTEARDAGYYSGLYGEGLGANDFTGMEKFYHEFLKIHGPVYSAKMPPMAPPLEEELPPAVYRDWRTVRAPARSSLDRKLDETITIFQQLARDPRRREEAIQQVAALPDELYDEYCRRTRRHRLAQWEFIIENPGCIPADTSLPAQKAMIKQKEERIRTLNSLINMFPALETQALQRKILSDTQASLQRQAARDAQEQDAKKSGKKGGGKRVREDGSDPTILTSAQQQYDANYRQNRTNSVEGDAVSNPTIDPKLSIDDILQRQEFDTSEPVVGAAELAEMAAMISTVFGEDDGLARAYKQKIRSLEP